MAFDGTGVYCCFAIIPLAVDAVLRCVMPCRWSWPLYWVAQGTMFWAIFVLGHDCGHGSFSDSRQVGVWCKSATSWRVKHTINSITDMRQGASVVSKRGLAGSEKPAASYAISCGTLSNLC